MNTKELKVGQEIAIVHHHHLYAARFMFGYKVAKVTPTGRVTVIRESDNYQRLFDNRGVEMGKYSDNDRLILVEEARAAADYQNRKLKAADLLNQVRSENTVRSTWSKEGMLDTVSELEAKLAAAKAAVEAI